MLVILHIIAVVQSLNHVWLLETPWTAAHQAPLSFIISGNLLKFLSIELVMLSNHLILCWPPSPPASVFPSIRVFSNESVLRIRWPKYWSLQLQHLSFQWIFRTGFLYDGLVWSPCSPRDSQEFSPPSQFKSVNSSALSLLSSPNSHIHIWLLEKPQLWLDGPLSAMSLLFNTLPWFVKKLFFEGASIF